MPHVTGTICHITYTATPDPVHRHLSHRPCPAPSRQARAACAGPECVSEAPCTSYAEDTAVFCSGTSIFQLGGGACCGLWTSPRTSLTFVGIARSRELSIPAQLRLPELRISWPPIWRSGCGYSQHDSPGDGSCPPHGAVQLASPEFAASSSPSANIHRFISLACLPCKSTIASVLPADMLRVRAFSWQTSFTKVWPTSVLACPTPPRPPSRP